uniref:Outer dynein arm-docking complex subunit 4 n=1 Tax=Trichobilharzia regenti TaxID=157069 RepID=A0AA85INC3_TRIRE|nr:unnamed protein product [Trichobilharzia regenti]
MSDKSSELFVFNGIEAYWAIARTLQIRGEYKRALYYLQLALDEDNQHIKSYLLRAYCYMQLFELDKALSDVQTVLQFEKRNPHAILLLGEIYYLRGDFEEALTSFHQGRILRPTIEYFLTGVHKCEDAIKNSCTSGRLKLSPRLDLTEFYLKAFPPSKRDHRKTRVVRKIVKKDDDILTWPVPQPKIIRDKLMKQTYPHYSYLESLFKEEERRENQFENQQPEFFPDLLPILNRSYENKVSSVNCANYLNRHTDLWYKLNPHVRNSKNYL